jgi:urease accessory protein
MVNTRLKPKKTRPSGLTSGSYRMVFHASGQAARSAVFAANRAIGRIDLTVRAENGVTRRRRVGEEGSLRVRFPGPLAADLDAVVVNTAGGIAGGDRFDFAVEVDEGASLTVSTAAAEKVYRSLGPSSTMAARLTVKRGATLAWLPQETILFDGARLERRIDVELAETASLLLAEAVIFGRLAMGEKVQHGKLSDRWHIRREGKLLHVEAMRLEGAIAAKLSERAIAADGAAIATVLLVPGTDADVAKVRILTDAFRGEVGASSWNGIAVVRCVARDGVTLRHDLTRVLGALRSAPLPRLWHS